MPTPSQRKGARWEKACVDYINDRLEGAGLEVERQRQAGRLDRGDLGGLDLWALECKDDASMSPQAMAAQADREAKNAGKPFGVALRKTRGKGAQGGTVIMTMETWLDLVEYVEGLRKQFREEPF